MRSVTQKVQICYESVLEKQNDCLDRFVTSFSRDFSIVCCLLQTGKTCRVFEFPLNLKMTIISYAKYDDNSKIKK